jgi:predicted DNA-binding protein (MmcQ/YjbR family)
MPVNPLPRLRRLCLALPQAVEVAAWDTSTFRCGKIFAMFSHAEDTVHSGGRYGVWLKAAPGNQQLMVRADPDRFFVPPYVGKAGWIGVRLDKNPPWKEIATLVEESWRLIAPKKLVKARDAELSGRPAAPAAAGSRSRRAARAPARGR